MLSSSDIVITEVTRMAILVPWNFQGFFDWSAEKKTTMAIELLAETIIGIILTVNDGRAAKKSRK